MRKTILTLLLAIMASVGTMFAEIYSGNCGAEGDGSNLQWTLDTETGVLTISGTGKMRNYGKDLGLGNAPWYSYCSSISSVSLSEGLTCIGWAAFIDCTKLTSITIPESVSEIGFRSFRGCSGLKAVHIYDLSAWCKIEFCDINYISSVKENNPLSQAQHLYLNGVEVTDLIIPNDVTSIPRIAFFNCTAFTSVSIPESVTSIETGAFSGCTGLTTITIPKSVEELGSGAFGNCFGMTSVICEAPTPPLITEEGYGGRFTPFGNNNCPIYVPCGGLDAYKSADIWSSEASRIQYKPESFNISVECNSTEGSVSKPTLETVCDNPVTITATSNNGYHFTQWSDGITDNPRSVKVTQDTSFTAEFAKNKYSVKAVSNNTTMGRVSGGSVVEYLDEIILTATPKQGYHFAYWLCGGDRFTDNPLSVTVREEATYTAYFEINSYTIKTETDPVRGSVSAPDKANYLEQVELSATANYGYHFAQWSDGIKDNPRTIMVVQDTTFTAEFAKNEYTVTAATSNAAFGTTSGNVVAEYLDVASITAIPQYGYHFAYWLSGDNKYYDNPLSIKVNNDVAYTAYFEANTYFIDAYSNPLQGIVSAPAEANYLERVTLTATPQAGYEFAQWSDGNKDNPRVFVITQDTSFTAEFAKAQYTISTDVNNGDRGIAAGDKVAEYQTSVTLTATANYGYHFGYWECSGKQYTSNPLTVSVTGNATYTAYFVPNAYSVDAYSANPDWGSVSAPSSAEYLSNITLTAEPVKGAKFVQWSDGNKDNPRTVQITENIILSAEFAVLTEGQYHAEVRWHFKDNALFIHAPECDGCGDMYGDCVDSWELLIPQIKKLVIGENMTHVIPAEISKLTNLSSVEWNAVNYTAPASETEAPFYSKRSRISSFEFGKQVKKIPAYLCYEMTGLTFVTFGSKVTNIGKHAFDGCEDLEAITCEATTPPNCGADAFAGVSIFIPVYVPVNSVDMYSVAPVWKDFYTFSSIQAETKTVSEVQATPAENSVVMEWPSVADAEIYTLVIKRGDVTFCILSFNAQGQLLGIQFAPGRGGVRRTTAATQTAMGWQFTITSLNPGTTYDYTVTAKKEDDTLLYTQSGSFTTTGSATGLDEINASNSQTLKLIKHGQLYILRNGEIFNATGARVE